MGWDFGSPSCAYCTSGYGVYSPLRACECPVYQCTLYHCIPGTHECLSLSKSHVYLGTSVCCIPPSQALELRIS